MEYSIKLIYDNGDIVDLPRLYDKLSLEEFVDIMMAADPHITKVEATLTFIRKS